MDIEQLEKRLKKEMEKAKFQNNLSRTEESQERVDELKSVTESLNWLKHSLGDDLQKELEKVYKEAQTVLESYNGWKIGRTHDETETRLTIYQQDYKDGNEEYEYSDLKVVYESGKFEDVEAMEILLIFWLKEIDEYDLHNKTMKKTGRKPEDAKKHIVYIAILSYIS